MHSWQEQDKFINGKIKSSSKNDALFVTYERCDNIVLAWISASLSPDIAQSTIYMDNTTQLYTCLQNRSSKSSHFRLSDILQQIHFMHRGEKFVTAYFNELKTLWEDLETLIILPTCTCDSHTTMKKQHNMKCVICFLKGFNDVKSQILMLKPFQSFVFDLATRTTIIISF